MWGCPTPFSFFRVRYDTTLHCFKSASTAYCCTRVLSKERVKSHSVRVYLSVFMNEISSLHITKTTQNIKANLFRVIECTTDDLIALYLAHLHWGNRDLFESSWIKGIFLCIYSSFCNNNNNIFVRKVQENNNTM